MGPCCSQGKKLPEQDADAQAILTTMLEDGLRHSCSGRHNLLFCLTERSAAGGWTEPLLDDLFQGIGVCIFVLSTGRVEFFAWSAWALVPKLRTLLWPPPPEAYARLAEAALLN